MSRFDDGDEENFPNQQALYAQATKNALKGKRGQAALKELEEALLAMPEKRLIEGGLCDNAGGVCAVGAMAVHRQVKAGLMTREDAMTMIATKYGDDFHATLEVGREVLGLLGCVAVEFAYVNDEEACASTPEDRYDIVLNWVREQIGHKS